MPLAPARGAALPSVAAIASQLAARLVAEPAAQVQS
jgi:formylmethanofuran dehydrogenase subunit B